MSGLHARLLAELDRLDAVTEAVSVALAKHGLGSELDDTDRRRRLTHYRRVLERHAPVDERPYRKTKCRHHVGAGVSHVVDYPCPDLRDLADALGIAVDGAS